MKPRTYATPAAFKAALEQRLRDSSKSGVELARRRQLLVFDRLLARVARVLGKAAMLKGGLVLELRLERARTTRDVDLRLVGSPEDALARLQEAGRVDLGDFMTFEIQADAQQPEMDFQGRRNDGFRYRAECKLAGQIYGQRFGVDVAFADPVLGEPDVVVAEDFLAFAGIEPPKVRLYPVETHLAEKVHAYTRCTLQSADLYERARRLAASWDEPAGPVQCAHALAMAAVSPLTSKALLKRCALLRWKRTRRQRG